MLGVVGRAGGHIDLGVQRKLKVVRLFSMSGAFSSEIDLARLEVELEALLGDVGHVDGQVNIVFFSVDLAAALGPENYSRTTYIS